MNFRLQLVAGLTLMIGSSTVIADETGTQLYLTNCANCHGVYGEGDGVVSPDLPVALLDLRYLSQRNDGQFPAEFVTEIIDGRISRSAHGPEDMPVWGALFAASDDPDTDTAAQAQRRIDALTEFLRGIQIKP